MKNQHAPGDILEVTSLEQMAALADMRPWRWFGTATNIHMRIPFVEGALQETAERRLNFLRGICGCQTGAFFVLASLAWCIASPPRGHESMFSLVLHGAAFVLGAGIFGKILTILVARMMFISEASLFVWRARRVGQQRRLAP